MTEKQKEKMTVQEFFSLLEKHDWTYMYSDDHRSFVSGEKSYKNLDLLSSTSENHLSLFKDYQEYKNSDKPKPLVNDYFSIEERSLIKPEVPRMRRPRTDTFIFELDGCICDDEWRLPLQEDQYHESCSKDKEIRPTTSICRQLYAGGFDIIFVTDRMESLRPQTEKWLKNKGLRFNKLLMRPNGNSEPIESVKKEMYRKSIKDQFNVLSVFEKRSTVVDMWRELGLTCYNA